MTNQSGKKRCSKCEEIKDLRHFYNSSKSNDGKRAMCKSCVNKYNVKKYGNDKAAAYISRRYQ